MAADQTFDSKKSFKTCTLHHSSIYNGTDQVQKDGCNIELHSNYSQFLGRHNVNSPLKFSGFSGQNHEEKTMLWQI